MRAITLLLANFTLKLRAMARHAWICESDDEEDDDKEAEEDSEEESDDEELFVEQLRWSEVDEWAEVIRKKGREGRG